MFKYISEILSKISQSQRIAALVILVVAGVSIILVPQYFDRKDCSDLYQEVENQGDQILQLNRKIVDNDNRYTQEKLQREVEIRQIISKLSDELEKLKRQSYYYERQGQLILESYSRDTISNSTKIKSPILHLDFSNVEHEIKCLNNMVSKQKK